MLLAGYRGVSTIYQRTAVWGRSSVLQYVPDLTPHTFSP